MTNMNPFESIPTVGYIEKVEETPNGKRYTISFKAGKIRKITGYFNIGDKYKEGCSVPMRYFQLPILGTSVITQIDNRVQRFKFLYIGFLVGILSSLLTLAGVLAIVLKLNSKK